MPVSFDRIGGQLMDVLWVGLGGFVGANTRYLLGNLIIRRLGLDFPWHTFIINATGSMAIGLLLTMLTLKVDLSPALRLLLVVGFLGGYTTFSSYSMEAVTLGSEGRWLAALAYVSASNGVALAATVVGIGLANALWRQ